MNPVISREYVEKNYIHKDKLRELKKFKEDLLLHLDNVNLFRNKTDKEKAEYSRLENEIRFIKILLGETEDDK